MFFSLLIFHPFSNKLSHISYQSVSNFHLSPTLYSQQLDSSHHDWNSLPKPSSAVASWAQTPVEPFYRWWALKPLAPRQHSPRPASNQRGVSIPTFLLLPSSAPPHSAPKTPSISPTWDSNLSTAFSFSTVPTLSLALLVAPVGNRFQIDLPPPIFSRPLIHPLRL